MWPGWTRSCGARLRVDRHGDRVRAVGGGDAGRHSLARLDGDGERRAEPRLVALRHLRQAELLAPLAGEAEADEPARVRRHEVDRLVGGELRGDDEVALVLAVGIVDDDDHPAGADVLDRLLDRRELAHRVVSRSTYFARTSTSRLTGSPGSREPSVVASSVCGMSATAKPSSSTRGDGERRAVDGDRALLDAVAGDLRRGIEPRRASRASRGGCRPRRRGPGRCARRADRPRGATARRSRARPRRGVRASCGRASRRRRRTRACRSPGR